MYKTIKTKLVHTVLILKYPKNKSCKCGCLKNSLLYVFAHCMYSRIRVDRVKKK